jgi:ParB/RepB/Spo0J family partition protein
LRELPLASIQPSPANPRAERLKTSAHDPNLLELAESIRAHGVIQPIIVRPLEEGDVAYELVAGERRWRASALAALATIPALIRDDLSEAEAVELTVLENLQREDLTPLEEAHGVSSLLATGKPLEAIADQLGKPVRWVARRAHLANLSPAWREHVAKPETPAAGMSAAQLELIARLPVETQDAVLASQGHYLSSSTPLAKISESIGRVTRRLTSAPWALDDQELVAAAGACAGCPKRSSCHPLLWEEAELDGSERCLDATCWDAKSAAHVRRQAESLGDNPLLLGFAEDVPEGVSGRVLSPWSCKRFAKPTKGAEPALIIYGPDRGQIVWACVSDSASPAAKKAASPPTTAAAKLEEKRSGLSHRRAKRSLELAMEHLVAMERPPDDVVLLLVGVFGTSHRRDAVGAFWNNPRLDPDTEPRFWSAADPATLLCLVMDISAIEVLWRSLRRVLLDLLNTAASISPVAHCSTYRTQFLGALAPHLALPLDTFDAQAATDIPEPKAWAKLAAEAELEQTQVASAPAPKAKKGRRKAAAA